MHVAAMKLQTLGPLMPQRLILALALVIGVLPFGVLCCIAILLLYCISYSVLAGIQLSRVGDSHLAAILT